MERTEEDKVTQAGIVVVLGGKEYEIAPLVIRDSRVWRKAVINLISGLPKYAEVTTDTPDEFGEALNAMLVAMPDKVIDLFFLYAKALNQEEIEAKATDAELAKAFTQEIEVAFPLAESMTKTMERLVQ